MPSAVDQKALDSLEHKPELTHFDLPPTLDEAKKAIGQTSCGKAPGMDGIPADLYKAAGPEAIEAFHDILVSIWQEESMPQDFRDATVVSLFKNKGNKADCGNYRGISLLTIAGKILARVLLNRLISTVSKDNLPEVKCGFRPGRSTENGVYLKYRLDGSLFDLRRLNAKSKTLEQLTLEALFDDDCALTAHS